mmetsp:Transcript_42661/g.68726  ORF Transcript_42661/g.68726 Transcript_42661/m.68726 type:complete len:822 (+) Transcript_42661:72-2537(+)
MEQKRNSKNLPDEGTPLVGRKADESYKCKAVTLLLMGGLGVTVVLVAAFLAIDLQRREASQTVQHSMHSASTFTESPGMPPYLQAFTRNKASAPKSSLWGDIKRPYPTHAFWENFVLGTGVDGNNVVTTLPYLAQATGSSLDLFYPYTSMVTETQFQLGFDQVVGRLSVGVYSGEDGGHVVDSFSDLGVSLKFDMGDDGVMKSHVVQGSPYVSYEYDQSTPLITSSQILRRLMVNNEAVVCDGSPIKGEIFEFSLLQFDETWRVYAYPAISLTCTASNPPMALMGSESYTGTLRVALSNNCTYGQNTHHCQGDGHGGYVASHPKGYGGLLNKHASAMVYGGDVQYDFSKGSSAALNFKWKVKQLNSLNGAEVVSPLMLTMPHQRDVLDSTFNGAVGNNAAIHKSIHGTQQLAVGDVWPMIIDLPDIAWHAPRKVLDASMLQAIKEAVITDLKWELPWNYQTGTGDPYNAGKMLAKMANIALVGEAVGIPLKKMTRFLDGLASGLEYWINGTSRNTLVYDESWGGVVSCGCKYAYPPPRCLNSGPPNDCPALNGDPVGNGFDFGNGAYNDHHFHYGYLTYAAAGLAHFRPSWSSKWGPAVLSLVRDIANPNGNDKYFPKFRHMDWYAGHSWAGGVAMAYLNGRNQESVSEAFNAWYGVSLWGRAIGDNKIRDTGRLLAAIEARGAHTYWQIPSIPNDIYPTTFAKHHTAGIIWSNLIQYQTWFGMLQWEVQGIQTLPVTPASELLLNASWTRVAAETFESTCSGTCNTDGWITFLCMLKAVNNKEEGWKCAENLPSTVYSGQAAGGNGNSRSNTLYWIATRP